MLHSATERIAADDEFFATVMIASMPMIASLPMYDLPEIRPDTDRFWAALAHAMQKDVPLTRAADWSEPWRSPDLLFSQTCGYPFTHTFAGKLTYVATPHYDADGCDGPLYCSLLIAREAAPLESFRGKTAAYNNPDSMSGMLALKLSFAPYARDGRFFGQALESGGHINSLAAVQSGKADVAAIDCVTVALLRKHRPQALEGLVEVGRSPRVPGLPFVTTRAKPQDLQHALSVVFSNKAIEATRAQLLLTGYSVLGPSAYDIIPQLERSMEQAGGLEL